MPATDAVCTVPLPTGKVVLRLTVCVPAAGVAMTAIGTVTYSLFPTPVIDTVPTDDPSTSAVMVTVVGFALVFAVT